MPLMSDVALVIPVYNEAKAVGKVIAEARHHYRYVIGVNDGSRDTSAAEIEEAGGLLVNHPINMGQGAALRTGIEFARMIPKVRYIVTYDADGQHRLEDVAAMLTEARKGEQDIILGSRFLGAARNVSMVKRLTLRAAVIFTNLTTGLHLTDTHNGLRVMNLAAAEKMRITLPDMAHASEILEIIKREKLRYKEVPVVIEYTDYSRSKGQSIFNAINIVFDLMLKRAK